MQLTSAQWEVIEAALEESSLARGGMTEAEYEEWQIECDSALAAIQQQRQEASAVALDMPDGLGFWAFRGHWSTANPEKAVIFHYVWDVYMLTDGELYFQQGDDGHPVTELTGKWTRITLPWEDTPAQAASAQQGAWEPLPTDENPFSAQFMAPVSLHMLGALDAFLEEPSDLISKTMLQIWLQRTWDITNGGVGTVWVPRTEQGDK